MKIEEQIQELLKKFEEEKNVEILLAVESGSRMWGFASPDSDYDIRVIYKHPKEKYLSVGEPKDNYEHVGALIDYQSWDLKKALRLAAKSNVAVFEWMDSGIVYKENPEFREALVKIRDKYFSAQLAKSAYWGMATGNYREYLRSDMVRMKKYFYVLRPLLACDHIQVTGKMPPVLFSELVDLYFPKLLRPYLDDLLEKKMKHPELKEIPRIDKINDFLERKLDEHHSAVSYKKLKQEPLEEKDLSLVDEVFQQFISK